MATSPVKELYLSPNGDRWALARNGDGKLVVSHHPSRASGGQPSEIAIDVFLSHGGRGPSIRPSRRRWQSSNCPAKILMTENLTQKQPRMWTKFLDKQSRGAGAKFRLRLSTACLRPVSRRGAKRCGRSSQCICTTSTCALPNHCKPGRWQNRTALVAELRKFPAWVTAKPSSLSRARSDQRKLFGDEASRPRWVA